MILAAFIIFGLSSSSLTSFEEPSTQNKISSKSPDSQENVFFSQDSNEISSDFCEKISGRIEYKLNAVANNYERLKLMKETEVMPQLMQKRYRKMDVEGKMDDNRKEQQKNNDIFTSENEN